MIGRAWRAAVGLVLAGAVGFALWPVLATGLGAAGLTNAAPFGWIGLAVRVAWSAGVIAYVLGAWPALRAGADPAGRVGRCSRVALVCLGLAGLGAVAAMGQPLRLWFLVVHADPGAALFRAGLCFVVSLAGVLAGLGFPGSPRSWRRTALGAAATASVLAWAMGQGVLGVPDIFSYCSGFPVHWP